MARPTWARARARPSKALPLRVTNVLVIHQVVHDPLAHGPASIRARWPRVIAYPHTPTDPLCAGFPHPAAQVIRSLRIGQVDWTLTAGGRRYRCRSRWNQLQARRLPLWWHRPKEVSTLPVGRSCRVRPATSLARHDSRAIHPLAPFVCHWLCQCPRGPPSPQTQQLTVDYFPFLQFSFLPPLPPDPLPSSGRFRPPTNALCESHRCPRGASGTRNGDASSFIDLRYS